MHDEEVYPDPFDFKPERFLDRNGQPDMSVPQPDTAFFGFGRRYAISTKLRLSFDAFLTFRLQHLSWKAFCLK